MDVVQNVAIMFAAVLLAYAALRPLRGKIPWSALLAAGIACLLLELWLESAYAIGPLWRRYDGPHLVYAGAKFAEALFLVCVLEATGVHRSAAGRNPGGGP